MGSYQENGYIKYGVLEALQRREKVCCKYAISPRRIRLKVASLLGVGLI